MSAGGHIWTMVRDGRAKTRLAQQMIMHGALHPDVRRVAVTLVRSAPREAHRERLDRLHRYVRSSVDYHREPVEMFHHPAWVLRQGGDCDDHAILLCSLGWALRYPWQLEAVGDPKDPDHYTCRLGWGPHDMPYGDSSTRWVSYETTVPALPGEHALAAARRLGL